jgi:hypothetical protein
VTVYHKGDLTDDIAPIIANTAAADFHLDHHCCSYSLTELRREQRRLAHAAGRGQFGSLRVVSVRDDGSGLDIGVEPLAIAQAQQQGRSPLSIVPSSYAVNVFAAAPSLS